MAFCLDCHRKPENALRPMEEVTNLSWTADPSIRKILDTLGEDDDSKDEDFDLTHAKLIGHDLKNKWHVNAGISCTTCHR